MKLYRQYLVNILAILSIAIMFASCAVTKNVPYFRNVPDTAKEKVEAAALYKDPVIMPDDILAITIITIDPSTSAPVNQAANVAITPTSTPIPGLLVDKDGNISLPIIGTVKVAGLTTYDAKALLKQKAEKYFKNPDVQLRFANFKISVLGEVLHPSVYVMPNEKVTVLDALSMAGDLTIYGRRENVLVIRDVDGQKQMTRLNLNNTDLFKSPCFYLRQNDVVYVEPNKSMIVQADAKEDKAFTVAITLASAIFLLLLRLHY